MRLAARWLRPTAHRLARHTIPSGAVSVVEQWDAMASCYDVGAAVCPSVECGVQSTPLPR